MASITSSILTNDNINMAVAGQVVFGSALTATAAEFSWLTAAPIANFVRIEGGGFTYSGSGDFRELTGGTITKISIDVETDNGAGAPGDIVITMLDGINAANIDKGDINGFWGEILKGEDVFNLVNFSVADIGVYPGRYFGDDFSSPNSAVNNTDTGADDTFLGGDNYFVLVGDVNVVQGGEDGGFFITSEYTGGNDTIIGVRSKNFVEMFGDAEDVGADGILNGGDDVLNNGRNSGNTTAMVCGDAEEIFAFAVLNGGDDDITLGRNGLGAGDVHALSGSFSTVTGGNDLIRGAGLVNCGGDVNAASNSATSVTVIGGNDRIVGNDLADTFSGDILEIQFHASITLAGGNDTLLGGGGDDAIYGEVASGALTGVSGGNDTLRGDAGNDQLFGQTGDDTLQGGDNLDTLNGGRGDDRLTGGDGNDRFVFGTGSGGDRIVDFADAVGVGQDTINLSAYGFANVGDIGKQAVGNDLVLLFGGQNQVRIMNYLADHTANDINDDLIL